MMAQENFITDSLKLDQIRMEKRKVSEIADLLSVIENLIASEKLDASLYESLRSSHPLVDDIDFRRILGMSETISHGLGLTLKQSRRQRNSSRPK